MENSIEVPLKKKGRKEERKRGREAGRKGEKKKRNYHIIQEFHF